MKEKDLSWKHKVKNKGISCFVGIRNITRGDHKNMLRMSSNRLDNDIRFSRNEELQLSNNSSLRLFTLYFSNKMDWTYTFIVQIIRCFRLL